MAEIERGVDGVFQCICNRSFSHLSSLQRHGKSCQGVQEMEDGDTYEEEESMESRSGEENSMLSDCTGRIF